MDDTTADLFLHPTTPFTNGTPVAPLQLAAPGPYVVGRSSNVDWAVPDQAVSRRHASISRVGDRWYLIDLGSRHGTSINGKRLETDAPTPIAEGDMIGFGAWTCRCRTSAMRSGATATFDDRPRDSGTGISVIDTSHLSGVAQRRLDALLALSRDLNAARDEAEVARAVVEAVAAATGCRRVVVTRPATENELEILASSTSEPPQLSRSLIETANAQEHGLVELRSEGEMPSHGHSIMDLEIRTAIAAAIRAADAPVATLVLDSRGAERALPTDASAFCGSVAQLAGLAFERIGAEALAARHAELERDLDAARKAQELMQPARRGDAGRVHYTFESLAGRVVAGDLFDILVLDDARTALFLGDVTGKGVGAAVLMAAAQSQLRAHLVAGRALAEAVHAVSLDLCARTANDKFVTLIAAVIDADRESIEIVDAGHGMCVVRSPDGTPTRIHAPDGFPLGVVEEAEYEAHVAPFPRGSHLVIFSDGALEQTDASGEEFGFDSVLVSIGRGACPDTITRALIDDVRAHGGGEFDDDLTVATARLD